MPLGPIAELAAAIAASLEESKQQQQVQVREKRLGIAHVHIEHIPKQGTQSVAAPRHRHKTQPQPPQLDLLCQAKD